MTWLPATGGEFSMTARGSRTTKLRCWLEQLLYRGWRCADARCYLPDGLPLGPEGLHLVSQLVFILCLWSTTDDAGTGVTGWPAVAVCGLNDLWQSTRGRKCCYSMRGSASSGLLLRTLPTSLLTRHAFISSAGNGRNKSTGNCAGSAGANHRS